MTKSEPKSIKRHEQAYVPHPDDGTSSPQYETARQDPTFEIMNKKLNKLKKSVRPSVFTRPSNDDVTNLIRVGPSSYSTQDTSLPHGQLPIQQPSEPEKKIMTAHYPTRNLWRIIAVCIWLTTGGFSDAAPGALLPYMEKYYDISYSIVSLIWISNAIGFIVVAAMSHKIQPWLGRSKSIPVGCIFSIIMYSIILSGGPYPLVVVGFFFGGIGLAIVLAQANVFLSKLDKQSKYLAFFHGSYGIGATVSPLIATAMVNSGVKWHYFYLLLLAMMILNAINVFLLFRNAEEDLKPWDEDEEHDPLMNDYSNSSINTREREVADSSDEEENAIGLQDLGPHLTTREHDNRQVKNELVLALKHPLTWLISFWVFFYQGGEVSIGGWIVTYLLDYRGANNNYGYVASGFWGGLTLGRLILTRPLHKYLGARRSITVASALAITFVVLTWVVPNNNLASVFVSLLGVLIGPNYPLMITVVTQGMIPKKIQLVVLTIATSFGLSGGAVVPFVVGLLLQKFQSYVVLPVFIAVYSAMLLIWISLPNIERRKEIGSKELNLWQRFW